jgi:hypothetical protein
MRGQALSANDVPVAAEFYRSGKTLAQLGYQYGVSPNAVRRALLSAALRVKVS